VVWFPAVTEPQQPFVQAEGGVEAQALLDSLDRVRGILEWKCADLDVDGMSSTTAASVITLGGLLKHLALVEDDYFTLRLMGRPLGPPWDAIDFGRLATWAWESAADDTPEQLLTIWREAVARSRSAVTEALAEGGLEHAAVLWPADPPATLRRILLDMIEEYARHCGHADLIRESVDGRVGEDPPLR
jgi:hypothetical protein